MSELLLDPRQEILEIIDRDSHKYGHCDQYVKWGEGGEITKCCINGLVMLHLGWKPDKSEWLQTGWKMPESWQNMALLMRERYGEGIIGDINTINHDCPTWAEAKQKLAEFWNLPPI